MSKVSNKKNKGKNIRGALLKNDLAYLRDREGQKELEKVEAALQKEGIVDYPLREIKTMEWYPVQLQVEFFLKAKELLGWTDKDIFATGYNAPQYSLLLRLFLRYFTSVDSALKYSNKYWRKHYDFGRLGHRKFDSKKKILVFQIEGFEVHPVLCPDVAGALKFITELLTNSKKVEVKETRCPFRDDKNHQFQIKWN